MRVVMQIRENMHILVVRDITKCYGIRGKAGEFDLLQRRDLGFREPQTIGWHIARDMSLDVTQCSPGMRASSAHRSPSHCDKQTCDNTPHTNGCGVGGGEGGVAIQKCVFKASDASDLHPKQRRNRNRANFASRARSCLDLLSSPLC